MPRHGVGSRLQKNTWQEDSYWEVVKVQMDLSGAAGKSYGLLTWRGAKVHDAPRRIPGTRKKVWRSWSSGEAGGDAGDGRRFERMDAALVDSLDSAGQVGEADEGGKSEETGKE